MRVDIAEVDWDELSGWCTRTGCSPANSSRPPAWERGGWSELIDDGEVVGRALRTQSAVKPVFVSIGHRIGLETATELVLRLSPRYRLPETTRLADQLCRRVLADRPGG